jgi:CRISPR/Cas system-associated endoribonuclease Cas2
MNRRQYIVNHQEQMENGDAKGAGVEAFNAGYAGSVLDLIFRPLHTASTGREALLGMLPGVLAVARSEQNSSLTAATLLGDKNFQPRAPRRETSELLRIQVLRRLERSVYEGELPENTDIQVLSCLCVAFAHGLALSLNNGISQMGLETSITLFVENLGFHKVRKAKRPARGRAPVRGPVLVKGARKAVGGLREQQSHVWPGS